MRLWLFVVLLALGGQFVFGADDAKTIDWSETGKRLSEDGPVSMDCTLEDSGPQHLGKTHSKPCQLVLGENVAASMTGFCAWVYRNCMNIAETQAANDRYDAQMMYMDLVGESWLLFDRCVDDGTPEAMCRGFHEDRVLQYESQLELDLVAIDNWLTMMEGFCAGLAAACVGLPFP